MKHLVRALKHILRAQLSFGGKYCSRDWLGAGAGPEPLTAAKPSVN